MFNSNNKLSGKSNSIIGFLLVIILTGCASQRIEPLADGGTLNPEAKSITKNKENVEITVQASAWGGRPYGLENYTTPFYVIIRNKTSKRLTFDYKDITLTDDQKSQYSPLPPETVARIAESDYSRGFVYSPSVSIGLGFGHFYPRPFRRHGFYRFYSPFYYPYDPFYYPKIYYPSRKDIQDIFTKALSPGTLRPNANLEGFIYFKEIPKGVNKVTFEIDYRFDGDTKQHSLSFPFGVETTGNLD